MGVSENRGTPKSSILIRFSIIFTIHFWGPTPIFGNTQIDTRQWTFHHGSETCRTPGFIWDDSLNFEESTPGSNGTNRMFTHWSGLNQKSMVNVGKYSHGTFGNAWELDVFFVFLLLCSGIMLSDPLRMPGHQKMPLVPSPFSGDTAVGLLCKEPSTPWKINGWNLQPSPF